MPTVLIATKPFQGQITVDSGESMMAPVWLKTNKRKVKVATQNQLQGCEFTHWELDGKKISEANPAVIELPRRDCEIYAVFKRI